MKKVELKRVLTIKFIVAFSLIVSMFGMAVILGVGFAQIRKSNSNQTLDENLVTTQESRKIETSIQVVGGEGGTPIITLKTTPEAVAPGESATIDWEAKDADVCAASGSWSGVKNAVGNQNTGELQDSQKYTLTCTNAKGSTSVDANVTVDSSLTPNNESAASSGDTSASISANNNNSSDTSSNGSSSPTPSHSPVPGPGGSSDVAPVLTLNISNSSISEGSTANLSWSINSNASPAPTCTASGSWSGGRATSGSENVSPGAGSYSYILTCTSSAGSTNDSVSLNVSAASSCGTGGSCSSSDVSSHNTQSNCWVIIKYTGSGGNGSNGQVYKIASGFFGGSGSHNSLPSAPSLSAGSWCGKNISSTFNSKHSNGNRSDGSNSAIWWLTNNGNSLIGPYTGS